MSIQRSEHVGKTMAERRGYVTNTVARRQGPTVDDSLDSDSTAASEGSKQLIANPPRSTKESSALTSWFQSHWAEVLIGGGALLILATLFNLSGQVGELRGLLQSRPSQQDLQRSIREEVDRLREELQREIDRVLGQLDRLDSSSQDSVSGSGESQ